MPSQSSQTTNKRHALSRRFRRRKTFARCWLGWIALVLASFCLLNSLSDRDAVAQDTVAQDTVIAEPDSKPLSELAAGPEHWTSPEGLSSAIQVMLLLTVISMAPAVLLMTTSFVRIVVVLGLLRQAMGTQQLPPAQVITSIAMFLSLLIMTPVWKQVYSDSISPYTNGQVNPETGQKMKLFASVNPVTGEQGPDEAWERGIRPIRDFMSQQIERAGNSDDVWLLLEYLPESERKAEEAYEDYDDVPLQVLLPAFILSELKISFLIGFQVYLPFLILDVVIASVTISMGMLMLPPMLISLPFKLLLFVLVDGWHLVVQMLLDSFQPFT